MSEELTKKNETALAKRESFIEKGDVTGTENIGADDLRLPRLAIAQGLSEQLIDSSSNYIPNLKLGELFNDLTGEILGKGPIRFIVVRRDIRYIEFVPRAEGSGIRDLNVPPNDPRTRWTVVDGQRVPPRATKFHEFVILMLREDGPEPILLSVKDTNKFNRRAADRLTGFIKLRSKPIYAGLYSVVVKNEKNDKGTFGVYVVQDHGSLDNPNVSDEVWQEHAGLYRYAEAFAKSLEGKTIVADRETGDEDDFPGDDGDGDNDAM